jgi:hypothetical protein
LVGHESSFLLLRTTISEINQARPEIGVQNPEMKIGHFLMSHRGNPAMGFEKPEIQSRM